MEQFRLLVQDMNRYFKTADHLAYITYPLVKDNKLMIVILENINNALIKGIEAILYYDRLYKRIPPYPENFHSKLDVFKIKCALRYNFDRSFIILIQDIYELVEQHKKSPMEFIRKDKFVICSYDYKKVNTLNIDKLKSYINEAKPFLEKINKIHNQNAIRRF